MSHVGRAAVRHLRLAPRRHVRHEPPVLVRRRAVRRGEAAAEDGDLVRRVRLPAPDAAARAAAAGVSAERRAADDRGRAARARAVDRRAARAVLERGRAPVAVRVVARLARDAVRLEVVLVRPRLELDARLRRARAADAQLRVRVARAFQAAIVRADRADLEPRLVVERAVEQRVDVVVPAIPKNAEERRGRGRASASSPREGRPRRGDVRRTRVPPSTRKSSTGS